jgi:hypothetical protein
MSLFDFDHRTTRLFVAGGLLAFGGAMLGTGCGGGTDTTTIDTFCQSVAAADCSNAIVVACYGSSDVTYDTDLQNCIKARSQLSVCNPRNLPYHADYADYCISTHEQVYQAAQLDPGALGLLDQACAPVFNRGGAVGTKCTEDIDCDVGGGLACVIHQTADGTAGTCQMPIPTAAGEKCSAAAAQCMDGLFCQQSGYCVAAPGNGETCGPGIKCAAGFFCDVDSNQCKSQLPNNSDCKADGDCVGGFCISGKCTATYSFAFGSSTCQEFTGSN